jgi:hypothetical protein
MSPLVYATIAFVVVVTALVIYRLRVAGREVHNFLGPLLVTCPDNLQTVTVTMAAGKAVAAAAVGRHDIHLKACTRWPEKAACGQECLADLEADPQNHRVWNLAARWFAGKNCIYCGKPIAPMSHLNPPPALLPMSDEVKQTVEWNAVPPESLPGIMHDALPVCWNCHEMETFRKAYPGLVTDRPWQN